MYFVSLYPTKRATLRLKRKGEPLGPFTVSKGRMLSGMLSGGWKGGVEGGGGRGGTAPDPRQSFKRLGDPLEGLESLSLGAGSVGVWEGGWLYSQRMTPFSEACRM